METPETKPPETAEEAGIEPAMGPLRVEKLVYGGAGLARAGGKVVLIPYVLPGELVEVTPAESRATWMQARLEAVVEPAPSRVTPLCPIFGRCGGCQYQHISYEEELEQKRLLVLEVFSRIGKVELPVPLEVVAGEPWQYRNRTQFQMAGKEIGFHEAGTNRLCPASDCPVSAPAINEALARIRSLLPSPRFPGFLTRLELFTNGQETLLNVLGTARGQRVARSFFDWMAEEIPGAGLGAIDYEAAGAVYRVSHGSFFQVNRFLIDRLVETALGDSSGQRALDLYAGVGLFTLPLARRFQSVTAVESKRSAARDLRFNAERAGVDPVVLSGSVESTLAGDRETPDFVLADPPRAGLGAAAVEALIRLQPPKLTIVACDPSTLARDLAPLLAAGYHIRRAILVDLFPRTFHVEVVITLER